MKLSIIIVSWNVAKDLSNCLKSIGECPPSCEFEIIVVDNASTDDTVDVIKKNFPDVLAITNDKNLGFAAANNQGIAKAEGEYVLLLNPDTIVHSVALDTLVMFMDDNADVGICGPKLSNDDGSIQRSVRRFPSFLGALHRHTAFKFVGIFKKEYKKWLMKDFRYNEQRDVEQLIGAAMMIRRSVLDEVGVMDENFFMYYEEVDLCYRVKKAGYRITFTPATDITHLGGQSSGQIPVEKRLMAMTSLLKFFRKHRNGLSTFLFSCIFKPAIVLHEVCNIMAAVFNCVLSAATLNKLKYKKSAAKIRISLILLKKYCGMFLFKM